MFANLSKDDLRREFSENHTTYYSTELFHEVGFERRKCRICGRNFWSIEERERCEDPSHTPYSFFKKKPRPTGYKDFWDKFAKFFKENGHEIINRYPVVSRWRQDLYFTIASIQDFQRVEEGAMGFEYPANPLIVPQVCLRFSDIENTGVTGRHFTSFMMAGQHAFDWPEKGYWRDRTIELNYKFLTEVLGIRKEGLVYTEDVWAMGDFSEFGPCLESFSCGLELVNSVFTQYESVNGLIKELKSKVVDVGWGFERLLWFYTGFDSAYESVFHDIIRKSEKRLGIGFDTDLYKKFGALAGELDATEKINYKMKQAAILRQVGISQEDYEKKLKPVQAFYAVLDHTRTLLFAIADGALPSNVGGGYNLRVILRRSLSFLEEYDLDTTILEIAEMEARELKSMYPELSENMETFSKAIGVETGRFSKSKENAGRVINTLIERKTSISKEELKTLYESNGINPELISSIAAKSGIALEMPEGSYEEILKGDFAAKEKPHRLEIVPEEELPKTEQLYYDFITESSSRILYAHKNYIVLNKTPFYPEGGGQASDRGTINGLRVAEVKKLGDVIVHLIEGEVSQTPGIAKGKTVRCIVDSERRQRLIAHHTATHLISAAARNVIGNHAWQEGARKDADKAHIDIAHYEKLSRQETERIEHFVNDALFNGINVEVKEMRRGDAEAEFGFSIYQGHGVPAKKMRIVIIRDKEGRLIDAEACGGMHAVSRENLLGLIKVINTYRIHDGVDRIEFVAGRAALDYFEREHNELSSTAEALNTEIFSVMDKSTKLKSENVSMLRENTEMKDNFAHKMAKDIYSAHIKSSDEKTLVINRDEDRVLLRKILSQITTIDKAMTVLARNKRGEVVCISGEDSRISALGFVKSAFGRGFKGGGSERLAEGIVEEM